MYLLKIHEKVKGKCAILKYKKYSIHINKIGSFLYVAFCAVHFIHVPRSGMTINQTPWKQRGGNFPESFNRNPFCVGKLCVDVTVEEMNFSNSKYISMDNVI